jgi:hypothetical protein
MVPNVIPHIMDLLTNATESPQVGMEDYQDLGRCLISHFFQI